MSLEYDPCNVPPELEKKWAEDRRYHFARYCWVHQKKSIQCRDGQWLTWPQIFLRNEGISLWAYANMRKKKKTIDTPTPQRSLWGDR